VTVEITYLDTQQIVGGILIIGIAAFGAVEIARSIFPSIDLIGFKEIKLMVVRLTPEDGELPQNILPRADILESLEANWKIGADVIYQRETAKSLVKIHLSPNNAAATATSVNIDPNLLRYAAVSLNTGESLPKADHNIYKRFELVVSALLDQAFQGASRTYRNSMKFWAAVICVIFSFSGCAGLEGLLFWNHPKDILMALMGGLVAAPIAPLAKDVSSAVSTAVRSKIAKVLRGD
jgi:hypothetical protein